jgi:hypothetical protein
VRFKTTVQKRGQIDTAGLKLLTVVGQELSAVAYEDLHLDAISVSESKLTGCVFRNVRTRSASFGAGRKQSVYTDCLFDRCDFEVGVAGNARFVGCEFTSCKLAGIVSVTLELIDCEFSATTVRGCVFHAKVPVSSPVYRDRKLNEFRGNDFSRAELIDTDFRGGIELEERHLPHGRGYLLVRDIPGALQAGEVLSRSLAEPSDQRNLQKFMRRLTFAASQGQTSVLLLTSELGGLEDEWRRLIAR